MIIAHLTATPAFRDCRQRMAIEAEVILAILHNVGETKFRVAKRMVADRKGQQRGRHGKHACGLQADLDAEVAYKRGDVPRETCGVPWILRRPYPKWLWNELHATWPGRFAGSPGEAIIHTPLNTYWGRKGGAPCSRERWHWARSCMGSEVVDQNLPRPPQMRQASSPLSIQLWE